MEVFLEENMWGKLLFLSFMVLFVFDFCSAPQDARKPSGETKPATCISCNRCFGVLAKGEPLECGEERRLREEAGSNG